MTVYLRVKKLIVEGIPKENEQTINIQELTNDGKTIKINSVTLTSQKKYENSNQYYSTLSSKKPYQIAILNLESAPSTAILDIKAWISSFKNNKDTLLHQKVKITSKIAAEIEYRYDKHRAFAGGYGIAVLPNFITPVVSKYKQQKNANFSRLADQKLDDKDGGANTPKNFAVSSIKEREISRKQLNGGSYDTPIKQAILEDKGEDTGFKDVQDERMDRANANKSESKIEKKDNSPKKILPIYLGPCENKNLFSCLDSNVEEDQTFSIVEPIYR